MVILGLQQTLPGVYEITPDAGSAFFLRIDYLSHTSEEQLKALVLPNGMLCKTDVLFAQAAGIQKEDYELSQEQEEDILQAALAYGAELKAMSYLARAEQCRAGLTQKLYKKGLSKQSVALALDYLEQIGYLDDQRFAGAWLRNRSIDHYEGRTRLSMELASRGIAKKDCEQALDEFFSSRDQQELCNRALKKVSKTKSDESKIRDALLRAGFTYGQIKNSLAQLRES